MRFRNSVNKPCYSGALHTRSMRDKKCHHYAFDGTNHVMMLNYDWVHEGRDHITGTTVKEVLLKLKQVEERK